MRLLSRRRANSRICIHRRRSIISATAVATAPRREYSIGNRSARRPIAKCFNYRRILKCPVRRSTPREDSRYRENISRPRGGWIFVEKFNSMLISLFMERNKIRRVKIQERMNVAEERSPRSGGIINIQATWRNLVNAARRRFLRF